MSSLAALSSGSGASASDLLRSSSSGVIGVPLRILGRSGAVSVDLRRRRRGVNVMAKIVKKGKVKHEYPWPDEIEPDPNVKGGILSYLSEFKPLKEKPKPVTLPFEKPLMDLEKKIMDVQKMAAETGLDFTDQILSLESKYEQALKDLYTHLTPIQRVSIARHPNRPTFLDHVFNITEKFVELHGDRAGYDDPAIVTGIGSIEGRTYMFIGHQKGRNTKENIKRNFGMPTPHGYRKALRMMYYADHHGLPIITFIDTPGAYADLKSEELGQGEAIAFNLRTMFGLKVPIVTVVIGEGGSGGALAIGCANKLLMLENAVFYVASPEACAAILWKTAKASPKAAEKLRITATELCKLKIADGIIPEPLGGAHADSSWTSQQIKLAVVGAMNELLEMDTPTLLNHRMLKFRNIGGFIEGQPIDPIKKVNMKKKEEPVIDIESITEISTLDLEQEVEKLKDQIQKSRGNRSSEPINVGVNDLVVKLKEEVDQELTEAAEFMGLTNKLDMLRNEITKARSSPEQPMDSGLKDRIEKLKQEFEQGLADYPNSGNLNYKLNMLKELSKAQKVVRLKQELNEGLKVVMNRSDLKQKVDMLKEEIANAGVSEASELDDGLKEKILKAKEEIASELTKTLKSMNLDVQLVASKPLCAELKKRADELSSEIKERIKEAAESSDLKSKIETLKLEVEKAGDSPDPETRRKLLETNEQIKNSIAKALNSQEDLKEKYETLKKEVRRVYSENAPEEESSGQNGGLNHGVYNPESNVSSTISSQT
ncbi:acetyl-coenzyme A carboxylase carboxyl transferase subunit alpha, chloroplastic [Asparagus officinalis]|uniref:acetyl-coenzyme A carboxylase carboxyl transferase subunit alpha, chloroplastic n=1 Tax=Asparagus officinalis TaxID=4686 RepID=UPI00098E0B29|nr:acetyl-coenzyme A carboxylase carboxyl transferase subunit alpha, chloroplastic [Asparagus officinalis]